MSLLRKKRYSGTGSNGTTITSLQDKIHGSCDFKINKKKSFFTNDYTYLYANELDDDGDHMYDGEVGVNKAKYKAHDSSWFDELKDEPFYAYPQDEAVEVISSDEINELLDILEMMEEDEENS